jgi:hypothetical protein
MSDPGASLARLHLFCAACAIFATGYGLADLEPSPAMSTVLWVGPSVAVAAWLAADGRRTRAVAAYDASLFFYLTWPVTIPWYAVHTRGRAGWGLAAQLYVLAVVGRLGLAWGALLRWSIGRLAGVGASVSLAVLGTLVLGA